MFTGPVGPAEVFFLLALSHVMNFSLAWGHRTTVSTERCLGNVKTVFPVASTKQLLEKGTIP